MEDNYILLVEKDAMWASMLTEVLQNNHIPFVTQPIYGAGMTLKCGVQERFKVLVPAEHKAHATDLLHELFPADYE